ncbi:Uncharacterised protein [Mycobacterium tuberculosis]|nr:Uncharacterised protein [Mycobacterium tuberculosis]
MVSAPRPTSRVRSFSAKRGVSTTCFQVWARQAMRPFACSNWTHSVAVLLASANSNSAVNSA